MPSNFFDSDEEGGPPNKQPLVNLPNSINPVELLQVALHMDTAQASLSKAS